MTEHHYLAVLKASYDYEPDAGAEDEIAIKENQILLLVARVDADWWKVKIKGESQEEESPVGLVPAAYVEPADHTSTVKALYDYEANAPGELTMKEDQTLLVFDKEEEWLLVQTEEDGGKAGFVPANYVEESTGGEAQQEAAGSQIVIPDSPPKPAYVDPADRVASSKITADDIQTWAVTEVDKKGKKKKGTLGVGNGAVFFASESDKTPVQKWQTVHVENITVDKGKHIHIDIGGPTPINLHFSISSKDQADAIVAKLNSSKELSSAAAGASSSSSAAAAATPKKNTVHFAPDSPTVIPVSDDEEAEEEEQEEEAEEAAPAGEHAANGDGNLATALYDFAADGEDELSVTEGEELTILERDGDEWWKCRNSRGEEGVVPASYLEAGPGTAAAADEDEQDDTSAREAEESAEKERRDKERREKERRDRERREAEEADRAEKAVKDKERAEKERKKQEAQQKAKAAAAAAEAEREKRKKAAAAANARAEAASPAPTSPEPKKSSRSSMDPAARPPADRVREWRDRTGQFRVDAAFLGFNNGKLRLHKTNGVIVEVPAEKMSIDDMKYVEKVMSKQRHKSSAPSTSSGTSRKVSEDDVPLAEAKRQSMLSAKQPKKSTIDWFDFFLNAGCDLDDCTRYADSFEKDKIDETLLLDITDSTMRSLGLREGDIIRVTKAIEKRRPEKKAEDAVDADGSPLKSPPNLFTTAGGALKQPTRRGRPQPSKTLPASVDLQAISTVSDQIQRTSSPQAITPTAVQPPPRTSSAPAVAAPPVSGFDDDAWTNRPSSAQPPAVAAVAAAPPARAPSAPPAPVAPTPPPVVAATAPTPAAAPPVASSPSLANTTESDVFNQLARLAALRTQTPQQSAPTPPPVISSPPLVTNVTPPIGYVSGMGMGSSPLSMGQHLTAQRTGMVPSPSPQLGPRGPFAPVPSNQSLLQPLIPTQTGFNSFIPTRASTNPVSPFANPVAQPSFLSAQPTGFMGAQQMQPQATGFPGMQPQAPAFSGLQPQATGFPGLQPQPTGFPMQQQLPQPTGSPFGGSNGFVASNPTGFGMPQNGMQMNGMQMNGFGNVPPVPPLPASANSGNATNAANVFAQMKSGTFGAEDNAPQPSDRYDALRPNPMVPQATGWGYQNGNGFGGYR